MPERTRAARQAVLKAWKREQQLVNEGKGTYDWTPEQQKSILDTGIAYDEDGYAFQGHHMQSVEKYPQYQGDPENIQFLSKTDHLKAHDGWYGNLTNWYYNPATGEKVLFQDGKFSPCPIVLLSDPIPRENNDKQACPDNKDAVSNTEGDSVQDTGETAKDNDSPQSRETVGDDLDLKEIEKRKLLEELRAEREQEIARAAEFHAYLEAKEKEIEELKREYSIWNTIKRTARDNLLLEAAEAFSYSVYDAGMKSLYSSGEQARRNVDIQSTETNNQYGGVTGKTNNTGNATRATPVENDVPGHRQRYHTKEGVIWKDKEPYHRGKKS